MKRRLVLPIWILVLAIAAPAWSVPEYRAVTILHTNDTHGHLLPFSYPESARAADRVTQDIGGIARRATLVRQIKTETRGNALFMDGGDALEGTPFSIEYMGEADFAAMSAAGYDIMVPGNHEFSTTLSEFRRNLGLASFPLVCANLVDRETGKLALPPFEIYELDGVRIAVFGLTVVCPEYKAAREGLDFLDPFTTAAELVPKLTEAADIVIALSHLGLGDDERLAREVPGIDVIVGGHSHARLTKPRLIRRTDKPQAFSIGGTLIVQAYEKGAEVGRLDLRLRRNDGPFTVMSFDGRLIPVTADIPECPTTAKVVARYYDPIARRYAEEIGQAAETFLDDRSRESTVLNLVCDSIREAAGTEIAIYGVGGIRADLQQGPLTTGDVTTVLPFRNKIIILRMTGERLKTGLTRFRPGVSGMKYKIVGDRITECEVAGRQVEDKAVYEVATIDWLVSLYFDDVTDRRELETISRDAVVDYIRARGTIAPVVDGRRIVQ